MIDTVFLELESYDRKGLKLVTSSAHNDGNIFILGAFSDQIHYVKGVGFNNSSKTLNVITEGNLYRLRGFSGGPVLNTEGEVIGLLSGGHRFYEYSMAIKNSYMQDVLNSPKNETSVVNLLPFHLYMIQMAFKGNGFLDRSNLQRLQAIADEGSANAQKILKRLDMGQIIKLGANAYFLKVLTLNAINLFYAQGLGDTVVSAIPTLLFGSLSYNYCARAFTHIKNRILTVGQSSKKTLTP